MIERNPGSAAKAPKKLSLEVSYDDGSSWTAAPFSRAGSTGTLTVPHPVGHGWVSIRTSLIDLAANTHDSTIIRAYPY